MIPSRRTVQSVISLVLLWAALWLAPGTAQAVQVTQLDLTGGSVELSFPFHKMHKKHEKHQMRLSQTFSREGVLVMGQYQPAPAIFPPITKGHRTFSLFTSGVQGAPPPSGTVNGSAITVDLTSLFFGISRGDRLRAWNIGGIATGSFDPVTSAFSMSWEHLFRNRPLLISGTFTLQGTAALVPLPASLALFASGVTVLAGWVRRRQW